MGSTCISHWVTHWVARVGVNCCLCDYVIWLCGYDFGRYAYTWILGDPFDMNCWCVVDVICVHICDICDEMVTCIHYGIMWKLYTYLMMICKWWWMIICTWNWYVVKYDFCTSFSIYKWILVDCWAMSYDGKHVIL